MLLLPGAGTLGYPIWVVFTLATGVAISLVGAMWVALRARHVARTRTGSIQMFEKLLEEAQSRPELLDEFRPPPAFESAVAKVQRILFDLHDKRRQAESTANYLIATQNRLELLLQETREYAVVRELYEASFEVVPVGIVVCDENHIVIDVNPAVTHMSGEMKAALIGRDCRCLIHPDDVSKASEFLQLVAHDGRHDHVCEWRGLRHAGTSYLAEVRVRMISRGEQRRRHFALFITDVTEQRRAEREVQQILSRQQGLIEEQKLFRYVFESNLVGMAVCDGGGVVQKANQRLVDILGQPVETLKREAWSSWVHPEDRAAAQTALGYAQSGRERDIKLNLRFVREDETQVEVFLQGRAQHSPQGQCESFALLFDDVTQRERAKQEQTKALESLQYLLANIPDGVIDVDPSGVILSVNPAAAKMFGYPERNLVGSLIERIIPSFRFDAAPTFRMFTGDTKGTRADGSSFDVGYNYKQRVFDGSEIFTLIVYDNSMVKQLISQLERARDAALSSSHVKSTFLATMTHELRTPLNGVLGMLDLLLGTQTTREQKDFIKTASRSGHYLLTLINNILDYSRLEARQMTLDSVEFSLRTVAEEVAELAAAEARDQRVDVILVVDGRIPERVRGDGGRLRQVLTNLLGNAVKFTSEGEILLDVRPVLRGGKALVRFEVQDTGIGIPSNVLDRIFDSFVQATPSTAREYGGSGLGLSICKQLVELMGGKLSVESTEGEGSRFFFEIPLEVVEGEDSLLDLQGRPIFAIMQNRGSVASVRGALADANVLIESAAGAGRDLERSRMRFRDAVTAGTAGALPILILDFFPNPDFAVRVLEAFSAIDPGIGQRTIGCCAFGRRTDYQMAQQCGLTHLVPRPILRKRLLRALGGMCGLPTESLPEETVDFAGERIADTQRLAAGLQVLAIDDVDVNLMVISGLLRNRGAEVVTALGGAAALSLAATRRFDLVLLDCQMPEMDGFEVLRALRSNTDWGADAQIVAMTAGDSTREIDACIAAGMDDVLTKPVESERLDAILKGALTQRQADGRGHSEPQAVAPRSESAEPTQDPPEPAQDPAAPILSLDKVRELTGLLPREALSELHRTFAEESRRKIQGLKAVADTGNRDEMTALTHALKGSGYNVGAVHVGDLCKKLESRLREGGEPVSGQEIAEVESRLEAAIAALAVAYGLPA